MVLEVGQRGQPVANITAQSGKKDRWEGEGRSGENDKHDISFCSEGEAERETEREGRDTLTYM